MIVNWYLFLCLGLTSKVPSTERGAGAEPGRGVERKGQFFTESRSSL